MKALAVAAVVLSILATGAFSPPADAQASNPLVRKVNEVRHRHGLPSLHASAGLGRSSRRFARHLMRMDRFSHRPRIRAPKRFRLLGEALAMNGGWRRRPSRTVRGWLASPRHRALVLSRRFRQVGAGSSRGRFHGRVATISVMQFGRR